VGHKNAAVTRKTLVTRLFLVFGSEPSASLTFAVMSAELRLSEPGDITCLHHSTSSYASIFAHQQGKRVESGIIMVTIRDAGHFSARATVQCCHSQLGGCRTPVLTPTLALVSEGCGYRREVKTYLDYGNRFPKIMLSSVHQEFLFTNLRFPYRLSRLGVHPNSQIFETRQFWNRMAPRSYSSICEGPMICKCRRWYLVRVCHLSLVKHILLIRWIGLSSHTLSRSSYVQDD
jgi:hypothetical protein